MLKIIFFSRKKKRIKKKIAVPTLPKILGPVTRNIHIFLLGLGNKFSCAGLFETQTKSVIPGLPKGTGHTYGASL